jgi:hypothetical protein
MIEMNGIGVVVGVYTGLPARSSTDMALTALNHAVWLVFSDYYHYLCILAELSVI